MAYKQSKHLFQGMSKDLSDDKQKGIYYIDAHNIRITAREDTTLLSVTNEKGNIALNVIPEDDNQFILGQYVGHAVLNNYLVLFTIRNDNNNNIWRLDFTKPDEVKSKLLYSGNLGFSVDNPIETLVDYETEEIQKVYWTDDCNQPRVINIVSDNIKYNIDTQFDFVPEVFPGGRNNISVQIEKLTNAGGTFNSGTIQYFITYYNKFGQESNIVWQSPLLYISPSNRGGSPSEVVDNAFSININFSVDTTGFDYIRIYSIQHTSLDTALIGRRVVDLPMATIISYVDKGSYGESIDPSDLYFKGGVPIEVNTMTAKDRTLFLGNIKLSRAQDIPTELKNSIKELGDSLTFIQLPAFTQDDAYGKLYDYYNQLNQTSWTDKRCDNLFYYDRESQLVHQETTQVIRTFKYLETYRFGLQLQDKYGRWSEPVFIKDSQVTKSPLLTHIQIAKDVYNPQEIDHNKSVPYVCLPVATISELESSLIEEFLNLGYVNIRPVIVLPEERERECVAQGVLCPTVYNVEDRRDNSPFVQSSWFFRPFAPKAQAQSASGRGGSTVPYLHNDLILGGTSKLGEIEKAPSSQRAINYPSIQDGMSDTFFYSNNPDNYYIDQSIVTLNSPDIEFNDNLTGGTLEDYKFRVIGAIGLTGFSGKMSLVTSNGPNRYTRDPTVPTFGDIAEGFYNDRVYRLNSISAGAIGGGLLVNGPYWIDTPYKFWESNITYLATDNKGYGFVVYPWQKTGSINNSTFISNQGVGDTPATIQYPIAPSSELKYKIIANSRYAAQIQYVDFDSYENYIYQPSDIGILDETGVNTLTLKRGDANQVTYYSEIDKLLAGSHPTGDDIFVSHTTKDPSDSPSSIIEAYDRYTTLRDLLPSDTYNGKYARKETATAIQYKSIKHACIALKSTSDTLKILPSPNAVIPTGVQEISNESKKYRIMAGTSRLLPSSEGYGHAFWDNNIKYIEQDTIDFTDLEYNSTLLLGEIYRDYIPNKFGGDTEDAIQQNLWIPAGKPMDLHTLRNAHLRWTEGDTYFQRYDCLKTFPYSNESENNIVEILSFMCESRVNIAGRYDKNRGLEDNTFITNENFNLLNTAYSQKDNFFSYRDLDSRFDLTKFRSQLTWTKAKSAGALVDNWANVTLANTLDLDGDKGELVSLNRYKNDIIAFQPKGISQIIYNPNVQINTESGLPIEIANSGKVQGKRYLYEGIGCQNKWSICDEVYGSLYFIDNLAKGIYKLSDQGLISLTDTKGFRAWMESVNTLDLWKPYFCDESGRIQAASLRTFRTFYDKTYKDVYFVNGETCLVYSDLLDQFISFMDYQGTNGMMNIGDNFYAISPLFNGSIWEQFAGEYNNIYNNYRIYNITFIDNAIPEMNKIYTNLEYRSDTYIDEQLKSDQTFDTVRVYNEYQDTGEHLINTVLDKPYLSDLQKKFRVWRIQLPRDKTNPLNRINNTWTKITLGKTKVKNEKTILHDAIVGYYI